MMDPRPEPRPWMPRVVIALTILLGIVGAWLRIARYLHVESLWLDEAALAISIGSLTPAQLLRPLVFHQTAAPLFLWLEWLAVTLGGVNELALRAVPLVAGLAVIPLTWWVGRRLVGTGPAALATAMVATSQLLIYYSVELKPYTLDAAAGLGLVGLCAWTAASPADPRRRSVLRLAGLAALLGSQAAPFVLAAVVGALLLSPAMRSAPGGRRFIAGTAGLWAVVFALLYLLLYRDLAGRGVMQEHWRDSLLAIGAPGAWRRLLESLRSVADAIILGEGTEAGWLSLVLAALVAIGTLVIARERGGWVAVLALGPVLAAVAASALDRWPLAPRTMVFLVPELLLLAAAGAGWVVERGATAAPALTGVTALAVLAGVPALMLGFGVPRPNRVDMRAMVDQFQRRRQPGDLAYVAGGSWPAWLFYTTAWQAPDLSQQHRLPWPNRFGTPMPDVALRPSRPARPVDDWWELAGQTRLWRVGRDFQDAPDPVELARVEVERIRAAAGLRVWLVDSGYDPQLTAAVDQALDAANAVAESGWFIGVASLRRIRLPTPDPAGAGQGR